MLRAMARLYCGLRMPATLPLDLLSDTENEQDKTRLRTENRFDFETGQTMRFVIRLVTIYCRYDWLMSMSKGQL